MEMYQLHLKNHMKTKTILILNLLAASLPLHQGLAATSIQEPPHLWQPAVLTFDGPSVNEADSTFRDYRLDVTFTKGTKTFKVPGYFAADGNASEYIPPATPTPDIVSGNKWRVKFTPDEPGTWTYKVSFRTGTEVAVSTVATAGSAVSGVDGETGTFNVGPVNPAAVGFFAKGQLRYVGEHYGQFVGNKEWFLKAGPGSPENYFGYADFDNTVDNQIRKDGTTQVKDLYLRQENGDGLHHYGPHKEHWKTGDPTWKNGKGKGIIGSLNYLSSIGVNALYMIPLTINDDGDDTWPWVSRTAMMTYDVSKLDQWDIVFSHMDRVGISPTYYVCENLNSMLMMSSGPEAQRVLTTTYKIYLREIIARFGYHLGMRFNLGEETRANATQQAEAANWIAMLDPYDLIVGGHSFSDRTSQLTTFQSLLAVKSYHGPQYQLHPSNGVEHNDIAKWRADSAAAGHKWIVANDESWPIWPEVPAGKPASAIERRERYMWNTLMGGGEGIFQYLGYDYADLNDITIEDFSRLESTLKYLVNGKNLFSRPEINVLLPQMKTDNRLVENAAATDAPYCFAKPGDAYIVYRLNSAGQRTLNLTGVSGSFNVRWYSPRVGGNLQSGSLSTVQGGSKVNLGSAPSENDQSWAIVVTRVGASLPTVKVNAADANAAETTTGQPKNDGLFTFERTGDTTSELTLSYNMNGSSATAGVDYQSLGTITIPAGAASVTRTVSIIDDTLVEGNETVVVNLVSSGTYNIGTPNNATVTVADNDGAIQPAVVSVAASDNLATESGNTATFTFTRMNQLNGPLNVYFNKSGTANESSDYHNLGGAVSFADGQSTVTKTLSVIDDAEIEASETVVLSLTTGSGYTIGTPNSATATILDNDSPAVITVVATDPTASETGDSGAFTFTRSGNLSANLGVSFTMSGSAVFGSDYDTFNTVVNFAVGQTQAVLNITIMSDNVVEGEETVIATLNTGAGYSVGTANSATIKVADKPAAGNGLPWAVDFNGLATGTNQQTTGSTWTAVRPDGKFGVVGDRLEINGGSTEGVFSSGVIDIENQSVNLSADLVGVGGLDISGVGMDYVRIYVKIDSEPETPLQEFSGPLAATTWTKSNLRGKTLQLIIRAKVTFGTEFYYIDNLSLTASNGGLPLPWTTADIGAVGVPGSASFNSPVWTILASGADIWGTVDAFRYVYQTGTDDCSVVVKVTGLTDTHGWAKAGVMIRESLAANSKSAMVCVTARNGISFQHRTETGNFTGQTAVPGNTVPKWLKITRVGSSFSGFYSNDKVVWTQIGTAKTINMIPSVTMGMAVTSHNNPVLTTSTMEVDPQATQP